MLWAAYQLGPSLPVTVNDLAITLFIIALALVIGSDLRRDHAVTTITDRPAKP